MSKDAPPPNDADLRRQARSSIFLAALLRTGEEQAPVKVRNISPHGAMIECPVAPPPGTNVQLIRGALIADGTVIWSSRNQCGVQFKSELSVKNWLAAPSKDGQQRVDDIVSAVKAGKLSGSSLQSGDFIKVNSPRSAEQLVDDLGALARLLRDLESELASSEATLARHGLKLQNLDIAVQMAQAIAQELTSSNGAPSTSLAKLQDLRVACAQALGDVPESP